MQINIEKLNIVGMCILGKLCSDIIQLNKQ